MCKINELMENLKEHNIELTDEETNRKISTENADKTLFFIGVDSSVILKAHPNEETKELIERLEADKNAMIMHHCNNAITTISRYFQKISRETSLASLNYCRVIDHELLKDDFCALENLGVTLNVCGNDLHKYIFALSDIVSKQIHEIKKFFDEWIEFENFKHALKPPKSKEDIKKHQLNLGKYPYLHYFNWENPVECGNPFFNDATTLRIIYENNHKRFTEFDRVVNASNFTMNSIYSFIGNGSKIQVFVDAENVDPYRFKSALDSLNNDELAKIDCINIYYDAVYSCSAWTMLENHLDIEVNAIPIERLKENKSLVDHKLITGVSKAVYKEDVDSIIIASSDSDFISVIDEVEAKFLVMLESDKTCFEYKQSLRSKDVFYCQLDKFSKPQKDDFFKEVFDEEFKERIEETFKANALELISSACNATRASLSKLEYDALVRETLTNLCVKFDVNGAAYLAY